jgi:uncharacterized protein (TIGR03067 family)
MKVLPFTALVTVVCLASALAVARAADPDKDELQGVWIATSMEINGNPSPAKEVEATRLTFKGQKLLYRHSKDEGKEEEGTFKVDPKKSPKQLDITTKNKTLHGIYEVKGDELKLCFENGGKAENRPKKFATNKEEELVLIVFKRQKP